MKLSCCVGASLEKLDILAKVGYKYCELALSAIAKLSEAEFDALKAKLRETGITPVCANGMFPGEIKLLLGKEGYPAIIEYLDKAFPRAKELGIPYIILGSGGSRQIPDDMTKEEAENRFCDLLTDVISPKCTEYGLVIGIEELNKNECNFINSCKEAMDLIRRVNLSNIKLLLDVYHAVVAGDTIEELESYGTEYIIHAHYGSPINGRLTPKKGIDDQLIKEYFDMFSRMGYEGAFSLEARFKDFEDEVREGLEVMLAAL